LENFSINELKQIVDNLRNQFAEVIVILKSKTKKGNYVVVGVSQNLQGKYSALDIFKSLPESPKGGGNKNLAQGRY